MTRLISPWKLALSILGAALLSLCAASSYAHADSILEEVNAESSTSVAGSHPDFTTRLVVKPGTRLQDISVAVPPGLVGNPTVVGECSIGEFRGSSFLGFPGHCPTDSQVGVVQVRVEGGENEVIEPLYNMQLPHPNQEVAKFGFFAVFFPLFIDASVRTAGDYGVTAAIHDSSGQSPVVTAQTTLWATPADPIHNHLRLTPIEALICPVGVACFAPGEERRSGLPPESFMTNPTACEEQKVDFSATSYQLPGEVFSDQSSLPPTTGCEDLIFQPDLQLETTNHQAGAPTGLTASLRIPQTDPHAINLPATSAMRAAKVTLPEGMTIASGAANGLEACSDEQVGLGTESQSACPDGSKLGTASFVSPALREPLQGTIYQRTPEAGNLFRLWLVTDEFGLHIKLPGVAKADPNTGQLTVEFKDTPQLPVEEIKLQLKGGPDAPLKNPDACGSYSAGYEFTPWSGNPPVSGQTQPMQIDQGCSGSGFSPKLEAGAVNPVAGAYSPFVTTLKREDGEENVSSFELTLPKGELAKLKGVPLCSDADAAVGSCPSSSQIGSVAAAVGPGTDPLWIPQPGKAPTGVFLAGPYKGAPYSVVTKVPAQAGPFDLGIVAVRAGLYVDPETAQATVKTNPLPQILEGVPVLYRTIYVSIDRPQFTINPTNCREQAVEGTVVSIHGSIAHPSDRFQVGDCAALRFGPSLKLRLKGGTKRGTYPALTATLKTHKNEANIRRVSVALPHSEFLAQEHIRTICTRVQFSEDKCPAGSVYGYARAVTPLLDKPLEGPVYLRSSSNPLPDLVVALHGQLDIDLVGRIDSVRGGIRTTFDQVPDAPVTKFVLRMKGGKKSLLVNSTDICTGKHRATVKMGGQNGRTHTPHPLLGAGCGGNG